MTHSHRHGVAVLVGVRASRLAHEDRVSVPLQRVDEILRGGKGVAANNGEEMAPAIDRPGPHDRLDDLRVQRVIAPTVQPQVDDHPVGATPAHLGAGPPEEMSYRLLLPVLDRIVLDVDGIGRWEVLEPERVVWTAGPEWTRSLQRVVHRHPATAHHPAVLTGRARTSSARQLGRDLAAVPLDDEPRALAFGHEAERFEYLGRRHVAAGVQLVPH